MTLQTIEIPDSIREMPLSQRTGRLIDDANDRIEAFMLEDQSVIEDFVPCDFHLLDQSLDWIERNQLMAGNRFCELGSGFGVATMLAANRGMESVGIEIEPVLVQRSRDFANELVVAARFFCGSFLPRDAASLLERFPDFENIETDEGDVYREIGLAMNDFDLIFAYPWPRDWAFFEALFDAYAASGALLLTYRGRIGMSLVRKM